MITKLIDFIRERFRRFNGYKTITWQDRLDLISFGVTPYLAEYEVLE